MRFIFSEKERKNIFRIGYEILYLMFKEKKVPRYYFRYYYHLYPNNIDKMYSRDEILRLYETELFESEDSQILDDKISFYHWCQNHNIPTPYTFQVHNNQSLKCKIKKHGSLFLKPNFSMQGQGCHVLEETRDLREINYNGWIAQENVKQHKSLSVFNSSSLNTMRVHSFRDDEGRVRIFSSYLRFGSQGSDVDNISSGGYYAPFDFYRWKLGPRAYSSFDYKRPSVQHIPESTNLISNQRIPYEKESKKLIITASQAIKNKIVGWDLAFSQDGPLLIEGNVYPDLNFAQNSVSGLKNIQYIQRCFDQFLK